jgi:hypothetical protein
MYNHILKKVTIVSVILLSIAYSCDKNNCCDKGESATIKDLTELDGCGYVVELKDGKKLEVTNLSDFDVKIENGNHIKISYHETKGAMSICMVGRIVEADCICEVK